MSLSVQAIVSEKGLGDLFRMEKEQPQKVYVLPFHGPGVVIGENIYVVGIFPRLPARGPSSGKAQ